MENNLDIKVEDLQKLITNLSMEIIDLKIENIALKRSMNNETETEDEQASED